MLCSAIAVISYTWVYVVLAGWGVLGPFGVMIAAVILIAVPLTLLKNVWDWARNSN